MTIYAGGGSPTLKALEKQARKMRQPEPYEGAFQRPKEPCPCCGSKLLTVSDDGQRTASSVAVICTECGCKGFEHCNRPLAICLWDSGAAQVHQMRLDAATIGWTGPLPDPFFHFTHS